MAQTINHPALSTRLSTMTAELQHAMSRMQPDDFNAWGAQAGKDVVTAFGRRVTNVATLMTFLANQ